MPVIRDPEQIFLNFRRLDSNQAVPRDVLDNFAIIKNILLATKSTSDPGINDDETLGYTYFSFWLNTDTSNLFVCFDPADGAAVWQRIITV